MTTMRNRGAAPTAGRGRTLSGGPSWNGVVEPETSGPSRGVKLIGSILAPTTFLTALLFYFGHQHAYWYFYYFGVNSTTMGLTTQDYVLRSVDPLFKPVTTAAGLCLLGLWGYRFLRARLSDAAWRRFLRVLVPGCTIMGLLLIAVALFGILQPLALRRYLGVPGLALSVGVLLLVAASRMQPGATSLVASKREPRMLAAAEWGAIFILVGIGLFWAATDYSKAVGTGRSYLEEQELNRRPDVAVLSAKPLSLTAPGVQETACQALDAAYAFRYDGLKLVLESGSQYFFLPADWRRGEGVAFLIPRNDSLRLEFTTADQDRGDAC
jgi:hypothetical protein